MKTAEFIEKFNEAKKELKNKVHRIMVTRMVCDNIQDLIPEGWVLTISGWGTALHIAPKEGINKTPDDWDKIVSRFAKKLLKEPTKSISKAICDASFTLYPAFMNPHSWTASVTIEIVVGNTEKCDIEVVKELKEVTKLTGYCKFLADKKYLTTVEN